MNIDRLKNKKVMVVESVDLVGDVIGEVHAKSDFVVKVRQFEIIPPNLEEYLDKKIFDGAIIHPSSIHDEEAIVKLHKAGVGVVIVNRLCAMTSDEGSMNKRLKEMGIPMIDKDFHSYHKAFEKLSEMFEKQEP